MQGVCLCTVIHLISGAVNILLRSFSIHQRSKKMQEERQIGGYVHLLIHPVSL